MVSLAAVTYRSVLKRTLVVSKHYRNDATKVIRSIFGLNLSVDALLASSMMLGVGSQAGSSPPGAQRLIQLMFRRCAATLSPTVATSVGFDMLRRLQHAVPAESSEHYRIASVAKLIVVSDDEERDPMRGMLAVAEPRVIVPVGSTEDEGRFLLYLPAACVDGDPFHVINRILTYRFDMAVIGLLAETAWSKSAASGVKADDDVQHTAACAQTPPSSLLWQLPRSASVVSGDGDMEIAIRTTFAGMSDTNDDGEEGDKPRTKYYFEYHVSIRNLSRRKTAGAFRIRLLSRHWVFTSIDETQGPTRQPPSVHEVVGPGVIGEFPYLGPGDCHTYVSGTSLATPGGFMKGLFQMVKTPANVPEGKLEKTDCTCFDAVVPTVALLS